MTWFRYRILLPFLAQWVWKSRCKTCRVLHVPGRMITHWQRVETPGFVAHLGGMLCRKCHRRLCAESHRGGHCTKNLCRAPAATERFA